MRTWRCSYAPATRQVDPESQPLSMREHENDNGQFIEALSYTYRRSGTSSHAVPQKWPERSSRNWERYVQTNANAHDYYDLSIPGHCLLFRPYIFAVYQCELVYLLHFPCTQRKSLQDVTLISRTHWIWNEREFAVQKRLEVQVTLKKFDIFRKPLKFFLCSNLIQITLGLLARILAKIHYPHTDTHKHYPQSQLKSRLFQLDKYASLLKLELFCMYLIF